ncbi:MAG: hypothetical protein HQK96_04365 [Nitrospirae bacterium]|nr:hypothetical protein [Nitrospirota bacterium]
MSKSGLETWALEYDEISGIVVGLFYKEADGDYSASYELLLKDGPDLFHLSLKDDDSITFSIIETLINVDKNKEVSIRPYDYEKDGKRKRGVNIKQGESRVPSDLREYNDGKWSYKNGYPVPEKDTFSNDKKRKLYSANVSIFMKEYFDFKLDGLFKSEQQKPEPASHEVSDLPF